MCSMISHILRGSSQGDWAIFKDFRAFDHALMEEAVMLHITCNSRRMGLVAPELNATVLGRPLGP